MKLIADPIYLPDNADWQTKEDAKSRANWHEVKSREELMQNTNLEGKCGLCKQFCSKEWSRTKATGYCKMKGENSTRQRTNPACRFYERKEDGQ